MQILKVFPTNRAIREFLKSYQESILHKCITIEDFEKRIAIVDKRALIDSDRRAIYLREATDFQEFENFNMDREYIRFLKYCNYLFDFFDELSLEKIDIDEIDKKDTYALYERDLKILKKILENYKKILDEKGYYDKTNLPHLYKINKTYLKQFDNIEIYLDGYLSRYEMDIIFETADITDTKIFFEFNTYSEKMAERFRQRGFDLEEGYEYELDITNKKIINRKKKKNFIKSIEIFFAQKESEQIAFVKKMIYDFLQSGIEAKNIVVITPNESFCEVLTIFDEEKILNFAMGIPYEKSTIYKRLDSYYMYLQDKSIENKMRYERYFPKEQAYILKTDFQEFFYNFVKDDDKEEEKEIFKKELYDFLMLKDSFKNLSEKDIIYLFLKRLKKCKTDYIGGGEVTVMGILESRLLKPEGVIIVDFDEDFVPKRSNKDLFLSNEIRKKSSLPTLFDRENLQKNYYFKLLREAKRSAVCSVSNNTKKVSRFLDELTIEDKKYTDFSHSDLMNIILEKKILPIKKETKEICENFDFSKITISSTLLKTYLECKRKFYFKYIKKIEEEKILKKYDEREIGILLHKALKILYENEKDFENAKELHRTLNKTILNLTANRDDIFKLKIDTWIENLKKFARNEMERFEKGYNIKYLEKPLYGEYEGFKIGGVVDRIDEKDGFLSLLDYKSGKVTKESKKSYIDSSDFQMEFYYILSSRLGKIEETGFYELSSGKIIKEDFLNEKLELLKEKLSLLKEKRQNFSMCEDIKRCIFCPYKTICKRDEI